MKTKLYLRKKSCLVNTLIIYYYQFLAKFTFCSNSHNNKTTSSVTGNLFKRSFLSKSYGKTSITVSDTISWNKTQTTFNDVILKDFTFNTKLKCYLPKKMHKKLLMLHANFGKTTLVYLLYGFIDIPLRNITGFYILHLETQWQFLF